MSDNLVWIDLEMTGLDPERCVIVEIATLVTDSQLNIVAEGPQHVIHQSETVLETMDEVVVAMHARSGLTDRIRASSTTLEEAERDTLQFVEQHCEANKAPLCGNSIWKDRQFLERYMPNLNAHLHYRNIDVSSIKELARRWYPARFSPPKKAESHRAMGDIRESVDELRYYRENMFAPPD
jgi:oligoribonuclease